jgi:hypothetical protein
VHDARRSGAVVLALDGGDRDMRGIAHETLSVSEVDGIDLDTVQHLVSAAAGDDVPPPPPFPGGRRVRRFRDGLSRLVDRLTLPPPAGW